MSKLEDYCDLVSGGLCKTVVTDDNKNVIDFDDAVKLFITKAKEVHDHNQLLFFCGNGASCTMAEHMSHDWFQNGKVNTYSVSETSHITAISNDCSYEDVFSYRINRIMGEGDVLITISSSGNSPNIVKAIQTAKRKGSTVITFSGMKGDNKSRINGNLNFWVPLDTYGLVETAHATLLHLLLDYYLDEYEGGRH